MNSLRSPRAIRMVLYLALSCAAAQACGPDFYPDTFVRTNRPDLPRQFVQGQLGLLQPGFARADLLVAYRYLDGGTLDSSEQKGWTPTLSIAEQVYGTRSLEPVIADVSSTTPETPLARWMDVRKEYPNAPPDPIKQESSIKIQTPQGYEYDENFLNCADDAFRTATATLEERSKLWGKSSPLLLNWLHAQDIVFDNCSGGSARPAPAPSGDPTLLVQDRAYQVAAADFYGQDFPTAEAEFVAISKDRSSPWQPISGYIAGRVLIRQAFFARPDAEARADYDPVLMQAAADQLRSYLATDPSPEWRRAADGELALVRIRLEPEQRARELAGLVGGHAHDSNYSQDLQDLLWLMEANTPDGLRAQPDLWAQVQDQASPGHTRSITNQEAESAAIAKRQGAYQASEAIRSIAPILDWTIALQSLSPSATTHALEQWRSTHSLPWLLAALVLAPNNTGSVDDDLLQASSKVPSTSPAWQTVTFHRARLLLAAGRRSEAQKVLADFSSRLEQLPAAAREPSSVNALRGLEMIAAPTSADFLSFVPRNMLLASSEEYASVLDCREVMKNPTRHYNCVSSVDPEQLDGDAARILNQQAPLALWLASARSSNLSPQLRTAIAVEGWSRAILLEDREKAASFLPLLPKALREQAAQGSALAPWITLAKNPGLRPYVNAGTQRAYSYDFVENYRDNWCYRPENYPDQFIPGAFLSQAENRRGTDEASRLASIRSVFVGQKIIRSVQANVQDPLAAEALYLTLRMVRYGCTTPAQSNPGSIDSINSSAATPYGRESEDLLRLKQDAARLLRHYYPASPWTKKAAPFVG